MKTEEEAKKELFVFVLNEIIKFFFLFSKKAIHIFLLKDKSIINKHTKNREK